MEQVKFIISLVLSFPFMLAIILLLIPLAFCALTIAILLESLGGIKLSLHLGKR